MASRNFSNPGDFPNELCQFLADLHTGIEKKDAGLLQSIYDNRFQLICRKYYSSSRWPAKEQVMQFYAENDMAPTSVLISLYQELTFNHLFNHCHNEVDREDREESFNNYENLFHFLLTEVCQKDEPSIALPLKWIWGMIDEFIYQFHNTQQYKVNFIKSRKDVQPDQPFCDMFCPTLVKAWLNGFVEYSGIKTFLKSADWNTNYSQKENIGYVALIGLVRFNVITGDFFNALHVASEIPISGRAHYWKIPVANAQLFYHLGVCYIMLGRYIDAVSNLSDLLLFVSKSTEYMKDVASFELRNIERMYFLIKMCDMLSTSPLRINEAILAHIKDPTHERFAKVQTDDDGNFESVYRSCMPKFVPPFRLANVPSECRDVCADSLYDTIRKELLEVRRLRDAATEIKTSIKFYKDLDQQKLCKVFQKNFNAKSIETIVAEILEVKNHCTQEVLDTPEDPEDPRPRHFQSSRKLIYSDNADFKIDENYALSVKAVDKAEDKLELLAKHIQQANSLIEQIRQLPLGSVPVKFSSDVGEPVKMQRVKREGKGRFGNKQRAQ